MSLSWIHSLFLGTVSPGKCHKRTEATRVDSREIAALMLENTASIISDTEHTHTGTNRVTIG